MDHLCPLVMKSWKADIPYKSIQWSSSITTWEKYLKRQYWKSLFNYINARDRNSPATVIMQHPHLRNFWPRISSTTFFRHLSQLHYLNCKADTGLGTHETKAAALCHLVLSHVQRGLMVCKLKVLSLELCF